MIHTDLMKEILKRADAVRAEYGGKYLCASHVAAAAADFCRSRYTGFDVCEFGHPRFEEERLRYLFEQAVIKSGHFRLRLKVLANKGVQEPEFRPEHCAQILSRRGTHILSADILFLCALRDLYEAYRPSVRSVADDASVMAFLEDTDAHVYDYVIEKIDGIFRELRQKSDEAAAIRDWKPAAKFAEPEELPAMCFQKIEKKVSGNVVTLKIPGFFGTADLRVSIHFARGVWYIHDHGCAIRCLAERVRDESRLARILRKLCGEDRDPEERMTGCFGSAAGFFCYLQRLVLLAHGDLYYTKARRGLCADENRGSYVGAEQAEPLEEKTLFELLKSGIGFHYDENRGLCCRVHAGTSLDVSDMHLQLETLDDGMLRISDLRKGSGEGEILGNFFWEHDDLLPHRRFVTKITARFGGEFDGRDFRLTDKTENVFPAMLRFFNMAVLLSEFGHDIAVPKTKR